MFNCYRVGAVLRSGHIELKPDFYQTYSNLAQQHLSLAECVRFSVYN